MGVTLIELLIALVLIAIMTGMVVQSAGSRQDRLAVRRASQLLTNAFLTARDAALASSAATAVHLDQTTATVTVSTAGDTLERQALGAMLGVAVRSSRDSMAYAPDGLGIGAANLTAVVSRGAAAETLTTSRLGRVRW